MTRNGIGAMVAASVVGTVVWAFTRAAADQNEQVQAQPVAYTRRPKKNDAKRAIFGALIDLFDTPLTGSEPVQTTGGPRGPATVDVGGNAAPARTSGGMANLLATIRKKEARGDYNTISDFVKRRDYPPKPLTSMTVDEVLAWQDSIDHRYPSEAAGGYQFMEDTLRSMKSRGLVRGSEVFSPDTQDRLAIQRMRDVRGLSDYESGRITVEQFAQNLSQEWAAFPAITKDKRGRPAKGQSFYAGDGLNKSGMSIEAFLDVVRRV